MTVVTTLAYELWDVEAGNLIDAYEAEAAALQAVRESVREEGAEPWATVALARVADDGKRVPVAQGSALVARALAGHGGEDGEPGTALAAAAHDLDTASAKLTALAPAWEAIARAPIEDFARGIQTDAFQQAVRAMTDGANRALADAVRSITSNAFLDAMRSLQSNAFIEGMREVLAARDHLAQIAQASTDSLLAFASAEALAALATLEAAEEDADARPARPHFRVRVIDGIIHLDIADDDDVEVSARRQAIG